MTSFQPTHIRITSIVLLLAQILLCTYYGPASGILPNEAAIQKISVPEIRVKLKELHDRPDLEFEAFLKEYCFDLHYAPMLCARPINLGAVYL